MAAQSYIQNLRQLCGQTLLQVPSVAAVIRDEDSNDDYEEENIIDEEEMDTEWVEDE